MRRMQDVCECIKYLSGRAVSSPASPVQRPHLWHRSAGGSSLCGGSRESTQSCRCPMPAANINKQYSTSHTGKFISTCNRNAGGILNSKASAHSCIFIRNLQPFKLTAIKIWKGFCAIFSHTIKPTESYEGPPSHRCNLALNEVPVTVAAVTSFESKPIALCSVKPSIRGKTRSSRSRQSASSSVLYSLALLWRRCNQPPTG